MINTPSLNGYKNFKSGTIKGLQKDYAHALVSIYDWPGEGIFCHLESDEDISHTGISKEFDSLEKTSGIKYNFLFILKKRGLFLGDPELQELLNKLDGALAKSEGH